MSEPERPRDVLLGVEVAPGTGGAGGPVVRVAEPRDVPRIGATLTVSLADSRWTRWALPVDGRVQRLTRLGELTGHRGVATGTLWVDGTITAVAAWEAPPGAPGTSPVPADVAAALAREVPTLTDDRARVVADTDALVAALRPSGPHWWLTALVTRPSSRRRGLAAAVLAPALERCDRDLVPAAAALHSYAAVRYLRRFGFAPAGTLQTADDRHTVHVVVRAPRPA